ncbi:MAG: hypothetical protein V3R65_08060 [Acidiferrobacterales bacterium]
MTICVSQTESKPTSITTIVIAIALLIGLPLLGMLTTGHSITQYLEFPPLTRYVQHAAFSWSILIAVAAFVLLLLTPLVFRILRSKSDIELTSPETSLPWWGWAGLLWLAVAWLLAWTRYDWFAPWQQYTFVLLWLGYIISVNAFTYKRRSRCLLTDRPRYLAVLFAVSAVFWWYFEYLNRFVQNWYYVGISNFSSLEYVFFATLSFSTVLPAVISTKELLQTFPRLSAGLENFYAVRVNNPCRIASMVLILSAIGLANIGRAPDYLFPLLWIAPLLIITSVQTLRGESLVFRSLATGNWRSIWLAGIAALLCGVFWEMWNVFSLAHWQYAIPFVQRFQLFEMPLLGYAGYLPFGVECLIVTRIVEEIGDNNNL